MSFQGAASVVFLIILVGAIVGVMLTNDLSQPSVAMAQAPAGPTPGAEATATAAASAAGLAGEPDVTGEEQQPGEGEEDGQQDDPAALLETLRAWEEELRRWQEKLKTRETDANAERAALDAEWAAIDAKQAVLEAKRAEVLRQRGEIDVEWERLAQQQHALQVDRVDLAARERQARTLAGWGGAMLFVAVVTAIACAAMVSLRPAGRAVQAAAAPKGNEVRPLRLRPKQTPQPTAAAEVQAYLEEAPAAPAGQPGGNGSGNGNGHHGRVL